MNVNIINKIIVFLVFNIIKFSWLKSNSTIALRKEKLELI